VLGKLARAGAHDNRNSTPIWPDVLQPALGALLGRSVSWGQDVGQLVQAAAAVLEAGGAPVGGGGSGSQMKTLLSLRA